MKLIENKHSKNSQLFISREFFLCLVNIFRLGKGNGHHRIVYDVEDRSLEIVKNII